MPKSFLVTGGAGFVGSHTVLGLLEAGAEVVVLDNLSTGHSAAIPGGAQFIQADLSDPGAVDRVLGDRHWDAVFHFAALSLVGESMKDPFRYLAANGMNALRLIDACVRYGVTRFILSSTANLFGNPTKIPIDEEAEIDPGSPYGESKWMIERALLWAARIHGLRSACLRYFNAAGADPAARLGEDHDPETHLIPLVIDAMLGRRPEVVVFGADYSTLDGTCVRDYVHVTDLAEAHLLALSKLDTGSVTWNLGNGAGHSVLEVIRTVEAVSGRKVPYRFGDRRPGDPAVLVAGSEKATAAGWCPRYARLEDMVSTALAWREKNPEGYGSPGLSVRSSG